MGIRKGWIVRGVVCIALASPVVVAAAVRGPCSDCHTMHNSQEGAVVAYTLDSSGAKVLQEQPFSHLLKTDCLGCHSNVGAETVTDLGESRIPVVLNLAEPTYPPDGSDLSALAGGNFHWLVTSGDAHGHNVFGVAGEDPRFLPSLAPGGVARVGQGCTDCHGTLATPTSGCKGCHVPQHHADRTTGVADKGKGWYRFLGSVMEVRERLVLLPGSPTEQGVVGVEDPDWERSPSSGRHNTYQGSIAPYTSRLETGSISQKCAGCHGRYHSESAADATWIRHPSEVAIPNAGEFTGFTAYDPRVPVARRNVSEADANFATVTPGSELVSCISCHRPHGSPYPALLRWNYRAWPGTDPHTSQPAVNGCAVCHTAKG